MAIESDQLVFDYLSRVGDLAQQQQLPSKTRMRLVTELRAEIDRRRAKVVGGKTPGDSPAGVRRILERLGTPEEVVAKAGGGGTSNGHGAPADETGGGGEAEPRPRPEPAAPPRPAPEPEPPSGPKSRSRLWPRPFVPEQRADERHSGAGASTDGASADAGSADAGSADRDPASRLSRFVPRLTKEPRPAKDTAEPERPVTSTPPHLAGEDEVGASGSEPDWWRIDNGPFGFGDSVPGFVGGVEIPEILRPPRDESEDDEDSGPRPSLTKPPPQKKPAGKAKPARKHERDDDDDDDTATDTSGDFDEEDEPAGRRRPFRLRRARAARGAPGLSNPLLLLAAVSLVVGAVTGNWIALGLGWAIAYSSRRLTQTEAKFAVLGLPGLVAAAGVAWLWGRFDGRWGEAVPKDGTVDALSQTWPWVVRAAAVASALFLVWRSQRRRPE